MTTTDPVVEHVDAADRAIGRAQNAAGECEGMDATTLAHVGDAIVHGLRGVAAAVVQAIEDNAPQPSEPVMSELISLSPPQPPPDVLIIGMIIIAVVGIIGAGVMIGLGFGAWSPAFFALAGVSLGVAMRRGGPR